MEARLADALIAVHRHLDQANLPHAFGGAIALGYCIEEPRATMDIDVNVFAGVGRSDEVLDALPDGVAATDIDRRVLARDGQVRVWWDEIPIDVFLSNHWFHGRAETNVRTAPFADLSDLPILGCEDLAVFKTLFARPKDAVDVATMVSAGTVDLVQLEAMTTRLLGADERHTFLTDVRRFASEM